MSSSSSSSSSSGSGSSSSSSSQPCPDNHCGWRYHEGDDDWYPVLTCQCPSGMICPKPYWSAPHGHIEFMQCVSPSSSSSSSGGGGGGSAAGSSFGLLETTRSVSGLDVVVVLPDIHDRASFRRFAARVAPGGHGRIVARELGWTVCFRHRRAGSVAPSVGGPTTMEVSDADDVGIAAGIVLPEQGARRQYWTTVMASQPWATLSTPEWEVLFLRA